MPENVVAASTKMKHVQALARRAARSEAKTLITGESGVGKDVVAREIHQWSPRAGRPYIAVNCAALTETLLESELFGYVKGSFTGAYRDTPGKIQQADGGTLFLDEVGEMSPRMQATLLRFLENGEVQRVGDHRASARVDVRIIAATNRNLADRVAAGQFREDLLYRIRVIQIHVPPLRERPEDIRALVYHFARKTARAIAFSDEAMDVLFKYRWPGNVRELQNIVEQSIWLSDGELIEAGDLPDAIRSAAGPGIYPRRERRRQVADQLFEALSQGQYTFWDHVHPMFLSRDLTRHDLRELVRRGLAETRGNYRALMPLFGMQPSDYHRFHNFLAAHDCKVDFRAFRGSGATVATPPVTLQTAS
jgi:transcriptional regulator with PAS, ATPase and Fis domain